MKIPVPLVKFSVGEEVELKGYIFKVVEVKPVDHPVRPFLITLGVVGIVRPEGRTYFPEFH
jgi:hypothetical protein